MAAFLAGREESLGNRFLESVDSTLGSIETSPGLGERLRSARRKLKDIRIRRVEDFDNYLILYRPAAEDIVILRITHGARDLDRLLG